MYSLLIQPYAKHAGN